MHDPDQPTPRLTYIQSRMLLSADQIPQCATTLNEGKSLRKKALLTELVEWGLLAEAQPPPGPVRNSKGWYVRTELGDRLASLLREMQKAAEAGRLGRKA